MVEAVDILIESGEVRGNSEYELRQLGRASVIRDFQRTRMCLVPHESCKSVCNNYLDCPKYQRDELSDSGSGGRQNG